MRAVDRGMKSQLLAVAALLVAACGPLEEERVELQSAIPQSSALSGGRIGAKVGCSTSSADCNVCATDPVYMVKNLGGRVDMRRRKWKKGSDSCLNPYHYQGIQYRNNYLILTKSVQPIGDGADVELVNPTKQIEDYTPKSFVRNHHGGAQLLGHWLFFGAEAFPLGGLNAGLLWVSYQSLAAHGDGNRPEGYHELNDPNTAHAGNVGAIKLDNNRILVAIGGNNSKPLRFYRSNQSGTLTKNWTFSRVDTWHASELQDANGNTIGAAGWPDFQNTNFLADCGTGEIYLIGTCKANNDAYLFRVEVGSNYQIVIKKILRKTLPRAKDYLDNAAGISVQAPYNSTRGQRLVIYAHGHCAPDELSGKYYYPHYWYKEDVWCGDGACNGRESCSSCWTDCGSCPTPPPDCDCYPPPCPC